MQQQMETQLLQWAEQTERFRLPRWNELPELELYMDQVVVLMEKSLAGLFSEKKNVITPAMVNNYVKLRLMPKPMKKKYGRRHLAYLIVITLLKDLFPIAEIQLAIHMQTLQEGSGEAAYNLFCAEIEHALATAMAEMQGKPQPEIDPAQPGNRLLRMASRAFACRIAATHEVVLHREKVEEQVGRS